MNCGISEIEWTDYLDQAVSFRERRKIEAHLRVCASCQSELEVLREVDQRLRIECGLIQQAIDRSKDARSQDAPSQEAQAAAQERILAILREGTPKGVHERLWRVRWVLALLCGSNTATRIIEAAESHTDVAAAMKPSEQKWQLFLRRLSFLTTEICGCYAGELIWAVGK